jgi:hypothetical protein
MIFVSGIVDGVCILLDGPFTKFNNFLLTPLVYAVGPITLITIFTSGTIRNLRSTTLANRHDRLARQIRRMLIPQLFVLGISGIPFGLQNIYIDLTSNIHKDDLRKAIEHLFVQIIRLFYHCNFVCTFYIYLYISSEVRKVLRRLAEKSSPRKSIDISATDSIVLQNLIADSSKGGTSGDLTLEV